MELKTLGGLRLDGIQFSQPKPLLLLTYLNLEGSQVRKHLAELFWPQGQRLKSLSMTLNRLKQQPGDLVVSDNTKAWSSIPSDAQKLLQALDKSEWQRASETYSGAFLEGLRLDDWSNELEEWVYTTREYLAERVQYALLNLAEDAAKKQDFTQAGQLAERAYKLPGLSSTDVNHLKRLYPLLSAGSSLLAPEVRKDLYGYGISLVLSKDESKALFKPTAHTQLPSRGTSFIGRNQDLVEINQLINQNQLVTILGTAGVGKTRLAMQVAQQQDTFENLYFVPLEAVTSSDMLLPSLLSALGLKPQNNSELLKQLANFIGSRDTLLVLDNLEQLTLGVSVLSDLLAMCPNLKILATSRERLNLPEEQLYPLEGLAFPQTTVPLQEALSFDAISLFVDRARRLQPKLDLNHQIAGIVRICQILEGLPLGIELAAAWVRLMPCAEIAQEIEKNLDLLESTLQNAPDRQRSLRAAFEYSWNLLSPKEQRALRSLSVFASSFRREAASEIVNVTIAEIASLLDKSLLRVSQNGRYNFHPLISKCSQEKLAEVPDEQVPMQDNHTQFYLRFSEQAEPEWYTPQAKSWLFRFDEELDNIRTVLNRSNTEIGLKLMTQSARFWDSRGLYPEAIHYIRRFLETNLNQDRFLYAKSLTILADFTWQQGNIEEARALLERAIATSDPLNDRDTLSRAQGLLARLYQYNDNNYEKAKTLYDTCITTAKAAGNKVNQASALNLMAILVSGEGDFEKAKSLYEESLSLWRTIGHTSGIAYVLNNYANIYDSRGDYATSAKLFEESLELFRGLGDKDGIGLTLDNLGAVATVQGNYTKAERYLQESLALRQEVGEKRAIAHVFNSLGQLAFQQENYDKALDFFQKGYVLNLELGYKIGIGDSLKFLGAAFNAKGDCVNARSHYTQSLQLCREINDLWGISNVARMLAILDIGQKQYTSAWDLLKESLQLANDIQNLQDRLFALEGVALLACAEGHYHIATYMWGSCNTGRKSLNRMREKLDRELYEGLT